MTAEEILTLADALLESGTSPDQLLAENPPA